VVTFTHWIDRTDHSPVETRAGSRTVVEYWVRIIDREVPRRRLWRSVNRVEISAYDGALLRTLLKTSETGKRPEKKPVLPPSIVSKGIHGYPYSALTTE
jgi:hypothetical protein